MFAVTLHLGFFGAGSSLLEDENLPFLSCNTHFIFIELTIPAEFKKDLLGLYICKKNSSSYLQALAFYFHLTDM